MTLDDKYTAESGRGYLTGIQALVRLPLDQMRRDHRAGLKTGAFISGYEGSPLGGYDLALHRARRLLQAHNVHFVPGLNEDLAATAVMGSQIHAVAGPATVDGVVGIWYGKGPGVDRSGDVLRHANLAGAGRNCGALVLAGDDHLSKSSTIPHQSDLSLYNLGIPIFYPGSTQEILDYGLLAIALSRFSGAWAGMKMVTNVCDGGGTVELDPEHPRIAMPEGYEKKTDWRLTVPFTLILEPEVNRRRLEAARAFSRLNGVNRWFGARDGAKLGIATAGKSYFDLMQALADLGIGDPVAAGIRVAKFGMTFPLDAEFVREFAEGIETLLVIEEKRSFLELQLRELLYELPRRPRIIGKDVFPAWGEFDGDAIAKAIAARERLGEGARERLRLAVLTEVAARPKEMVPPRMPSYCPGCPHNRSTIVPEGAIAGGGIGCHGMGILMADAGRGFSFLTQMGGEGAPWIGISPFVHRQHIFQNIGDGTYFHSGALAVRAAVAAGVNITYKILYNGAVAMTGGQKVEGALPAPELTRKLAADGVSRTVVLTDDLPKYAGANGLARNAEVRHRDELAAVMHELEQEAGVTVILFDQQCAAEKRRMRSRGTIEEPVLRVVIHEEVCEGCGDCVQQSNCMSLAPVETELGQKMRVHQPSCNKDYSCVLGDCPSFVTVRIKPGTGLWRPPLPRLPEVEIPEPGERVSAGGGYRIVAPGIGGTGVVTVNALLATAATMDGLFVATLDQTGLAQKGGAVVSHLLLAEQPVEAAAKTNTGNADLLLGFDLLGAAAPENLKCAHPEKTIAVINTAETPTAQEARARRRLAGPGRLIDLVQSATRPGRTVCVDASRLAEGLFGSHMHANVFLLGVAWQAGVVPVSLGSVEAAIQLNEVEVERNLQAFAWGRKYYLDAKWVEGFLPQPETGGAWLDRAAELERYQSRAYARQYTEFVERVANRAPELKDTVARYLYKLMAYKDEYEVARLLTKAEFERGLRDQWEAIDAVEYNLHPPLLRALGWKKKLRLGPWFRPVLRGLARLKFLRATPFDPFGWPGVRREERALIGWYHRLIGQVLDRLTPENMPLALEIAALPDQIRGYERIKLESIGAVKKLAEEKVAALKQAALSGNPVG